MPRSLQSLEAISPRIYGAKFPWKKHFDKFVHLEGACFHN
jgi:hypothetical protein